MDQRTLDNIATLIPAAQEKAREFIAAVEESNRLPEGWRVSIISGLRSYEQQDVLYQQGRATPGPIVTNAPAGYSNHNFGTAFDIGIFNAAGRYIDDLPDRGLMFESEVSHYYRLLAPIGKALGLIWGGDWESIDDEPHYELNLWAEMTEQERLAKLRALHDAGEAIGR
ncbi:MAG TPA: M15 family metallopeptidase [Candidatus Methylacidiphilales bacterium]|nr:M15 family metallopeptidase [Candidatus Methylacidiphilales bacterium]